VKNDKEQAFDAAQERLEIAHEMLDSMRGMCTENEESYEARRQKRQEEIDPLKDVCYINITILDASKCIEETIKEAQGERRQDKIPDD